MRLRQVEIFHAVYSTGSVSKAAELLNVSQPSVSKVLRHAEDQLGFALFERAGGKLIPTGEAKDLFNNAVRVQAEIDRLNSKVRQINEARSGSLRVAMTPGIGLSAGPEALTAFLQDYPKMIPDVETLHFEGAVDALLDGRADLAVVYQPFPHPGIKQVPLAEGQFVCVSDTKSAIKKRNLHFSDLNGREIITLNSQAPLGKLLTAQLEKHAPAMIQATTANTYHIAKTLAAKGVGMAIVDEITAKSPSADDVTISYFKDPITFSVTAIFQESKLLTQPERQFLARVKEALEDLLAT